MLILFLSHVKLTSGRPLLEQERVTESPSFTSSELTVAFVSLGASRWEKEIKWTAGVNKAQSVTVYSKYTVCVHEHLMYTLTFHRQCDILDLPAILTLSWATRQSHVVILPCHFELQFGDVSAFFLLFSHRGHISWWGGCPFLLLSCCMDEPLSIIAVTRCRTANSELFWLFGWIIQLWWFNVHLTRIVWKEYGVRTDDPEPLHFLQQINILKSWNFKFWERQNCEI